ncbi:MAG: type II toxin-antitoxin system prevent-host-death family antitoxin [Deltaproteobacteria bacterium]|nr:type II toxin-antitoxin system prevent-host-death family antitoxin [Deltaproteobacteria bacterium]
MELRINLREANQHLSRYVDAVARGDVVVITRRGKPIARLVPEPAVRELTEEQREARARARERMAKGYSLGGERIPREELHER